MLTKLYYTITANNEMAIVHAEHFNNNKTLDRASGTYLKIKAAMQRLGYADSGAKAFFNVNDIDLLLVLSGMRTLGFDMAHSDEFTTFINNVDV